MLCQLVRKFKNEIHHTMSLDSLDNPKLGRCEELKIYR